MRRVIVQGISGCFHEEAAIKYYEEQPLDFVAATTFEDLARQLTDSDEECSALMAIENSIAGSLLQNYRILRENNLQVIGEVFLRIKHNLMALPGTALEDIREVRSHPMALYQCAKFLRRFPEMKILETEDTALSARHIAQTKLQGVAAIASQRAAEIHGLEILEEGIEASSLNYTRFFVVRKARKTSPGITDAVNKASIYVRIHDEAGRLLRILQKIHAHGINMSKLQSYPVLGEMQQHYFHLDLEFDDYDQYVRLLGQLSDETIITHELGIYQRRAVS